ncbi:chemotaxis protein CheY [Lachnospiraceae bacterium]|nr:chemotaxis protein CheY [Lachnospiraceae bacterium]
MFIQLFSNYLVEQSVITIEQRNSFQEEIQKTRVKLGTIAVAEGLLTNERAEEINHQQTQQDRRFGDIAIELGYLTESQVSKLLSMQGDFAMKFFQLLIDTLGLTMEAVREYLHDFQKVNGFTDDELEAVKKDDYESIIPLFATVRDPMITDLAGLVMRNLTRFVTNNFYFGRMKKASEYSYSMLAGQKSIGDFNIFLGFSATNELDGIVKLANHYAKSVAITSSDEVYDAVCEFANLNNGLFDSVLSDDDIFVEMVPPEVYLNQQLTGNAYYMPVYIDDSRFDLIISTDANFVPGNNPHTLNLKKIELNTNTTSTLPTVLVVDDSSLIRKVLIHLLNENGYQVVGEAANGLEGVELYKELEPDIVTLDITMPVMDGVTALRKIKEYNPNAMVAMISAAGQKDKLMDALREGAELFFTKPFNTQEIIKSLKNSEF